MEMSNTDRLLLGEIERGLPLVSRPYAELAERIGLGEAEVIARIAQLQQDGVIRRLGVIVRHHELGYQANAMVVWDVPDDLVDEIGRRVAARPEVTLCYRRPRRPPDWPYNFYCMIHGRDRKTVRRAIASVGIDCGLADMPQATLFSRRRFKQRGARYTRRERGLASQPEPVA